MMLLLLVSVHYYYYRLLCSWTFDHSRVFSVCIAVFFFKNQVISSLITLKYNGMMTKRFLGHFDIVAKFV